MTCKSTAGVGRDVAAFYAIGCPETKPAEAAFKRLGMCRSKSTNINWNTTDATADTSPDQTTESLVTTKEKTISIDGVSRGDDVNNQSALFNHIDKPETTNNQPYVWVRLVNNVMGITIEGCYLITSLSEEYPYDDVCTWSIEGTSAGEITRTPIPVTP